MTLLKYIEKHFDGSQVEFANTQGIKKQQVTQWLAKGFIVIDDTLYSPRRVLSKT